MVIDSIVVTQHGTRYHRPAARDPGNPRGWRTACGIQIRVATYFRLSPQASPHALEPISRVAQRESLSVKMQGKLRIVSPCRKCYKEIG